MALPGSVPLLLLPLLLASAVAYEYQQLTNVTIPYQPVYEKKTESECISTCDDWSGCSGYKYDATVSVCQMFSADCRGPGVNTSHLVTGYHAKNTCPGEPTRPSSSSC